MANDRKVTTDGPNTRKILSTDPSVGEFKRYFICMNDSLHENLKDYPYVLILFVAMAIFVMAFLKMVTRVQRKRSEPTNKFDTSKGDGQSKP